MKIQKVNVYNENIAKFLFKLRNKPYVRRNSVSKYEIDYNEHIAYLEKFFKKKNYYQILYEKNNFVGFIKFELKRDFYEVSWAILKKYQGKGIVKKFLRLTTKSTTHILRAKIKENNISSLKIAEYAGFVKKLSKGKLFYCYKNL